MCFQIPKQVKSVTNGKALVEGDIDVKLGSIEASPGDYLLVYGNMAVEKISKKKARAFRQLLQSSL